MGPERRWRRHSRRIPRAGRVWRAALAAAAALAVSTPAPVAAKRFKCAADGGPKWRDVTTAHFVVRTNVDRDDARELAVRLERVRAALLKGISRAAVDPPGRLEIVIPRDEHFDELVGDARIRAGGWFEYDEFGPRIVIRGTMASGETTVATHELAHYLLAYNFGRLPLWLNEGLAAYFEPVEVETRKDGSTVAVVGRAPRHVRILPRRDMLAARQVRVPVVARARQLFAWGTVKIEYDLEVQDLYATSWAATHFLVNRQPAKFSQLLARLARGEPPADAWRGTFPEYDPSTDAGAEAFERALEHYVEGSEYTYTRFEIAPDVSIVGERDVPDSEVHVTWATLLARAPRLDGGKHDAERWKSQIAEALRTRPDDAAALWALGASGRGRDAVKASPADWRAWMLLARALGDDEAAWPERSAALKKATELAPENGGVLNEWAWTLLERGDSVAALPIAVRAAKASPWSAPVVDTLGAVLADLGRCREAVPVQRRAVELLPHGSEAASTSIRKRLEDIEAQCRSTKM